MGFFWQCIRPALFMLEPEFAHQAAIRLLQSGLIKPRFYDHDMLYNNPALHTKIAGLHFQNPLGMAAGFDKNALIPDQLLQLGFGFCEVGTVTPHPQKGNKRPRLFRLEQDQAIINQMGFNNQGHHVIFQRLLAKKSATTNSGIIGVNLGANKDSSNRINDYRAGLARFYPIADYITINISSPNTPALRDLQTEDQLHTLLENLAEEADKHTHAGLKPHCPIFLKISPDLTEEALDSIAEAASSSLLAGIIVSNTTISRSAINQTPAKNLSGGLSGAPLFERSTIILAKMRKRVGKDFPLIGVGGIRNTATALEKIKAGADLLQLYSGLIYQGPHLAAEILVGLAQYCTRDGVTNLQEYRDQNLKKWSDLPLKN